MRIIPDHRFNDDEAKGKAGEGTCYDALRITIGL